MEHYLHFAAKLTAAGYILYQVWILLFRDRLFGLWERIPVRKPRTKSKARPSAHARKGAARLVGRAHGAYLAPPIPPLEPVPVIPVEPETYMDADDGQNEDFEIGPAMERPSDEELYGAGNEQPRVTDFSSGRTYEQLAEMVDYVASPVEDDELMMRTAETLSLIRGTELFEFIELQVGDTDAVGRIMADCLDGNGNRLPKRRSKMQLSSFDIDNYV